MGRKSRKLERLRKKAKAARRELQAIERKLADAAPRHSFGVLRIPEGAIVSFRDSHIFEPPDSHADEVRF